jgi:hypothetical protein
MSATVEGQSIDRPCLSADIVRITQELFPGEVSAYFLNDPEYPECRLTVIEAQAQGPVEGLVEQQLEWHRRVSRLGDWCANLSLTLDYHE